MRKNVEEFDTSVIVAGFIGVKLDAPLSNSTPIKSKRKVKEF